MESKIVLPYAPILVESTRSVGYSFEAALADIIDNSIGNGASEINIIYDTLPGSQYICVIDDGVGMSREELIQAMRYGSKSSLDERSDNDLGRFGLGLKMASLSQCRKLTVISKQDSEMNAAQWDLDWIIEKGDWALKIFDDREQGALLCSDLIRSKSSGTVVIWENFDRLRDSSNDMSRAMSEMMTLAKKHIRLVFHRYLSGEQGIKPVKISVNNEKMEPFDPFYINNPATQPLEERVLSIDRKRIKVKPYIIPYQSKMTPKDRKAQEAMSDLKINPGFYVYRNKRLIIWGTWFRISRQQELNRLARIRVDIPTSLDSIWDIDIKKSTASLPSIIKNTLKKVAEESSLRSEHVYKYRGRHVNNDNVEHVWDVVDNRGSFQYLVNRNLPVVKRLEALMDEETLRYFDSFLKMLESSFPYDDVYYRRAKSETLISKPTRDDEESLVMGSDMLNLIKGDSDDLVSLLETLAVDIFSDNKKVMNKLKGEFKS